jgi:hypothetical protein
MTNATDTEETEEVSSALGVTGTRAGEVKLNIDYNIIEHFSEHLYGSPSKAVEELVSNGFDAAARRVFVYVPGPMVAEHLVVWDDGESMDVAGLTALWFIARSPKGEGERVVALGSGKDKIFRSQIGKFGIGKLASYAVGTTIGHLCHRDGEYLLVDVDYAGIQGLNGEPPASSEDPAKRPIIRISEDDARHLLSTVFVDQASLGYEELFDAPSWTVAIVGGLKKSLHPAWLRWVLGNGMPLRPDFQVWVNDEAVTPKLASDSKASFDFGSKELKDAIADAWYAAVKDPKEPSITGSIRFESEQGLDPAAPTEAVPFVRFPQLGRIWGTVRVFSRSLISGRSTAYERSHGFFIYVRGRLLNGDDDKVLLNEPSYTTFYSSQFILNVDGLDEELLADRERLRRDTARTAELRLLQSAVYRVARAKLTSLLQDAQDKAESISLLPTKSRELFREPLTALLMRDKAFEDVSFNLAHPKIERRSVGQESRSAELDVAGFAVNSSHPHFEALVRRFRQGKKAREFYRAYDVFAISDLLLEGVLYENGVQSDVIDRVMDWKDSLFREIAGRYDEVPSDLAARLLEASYLGDREFEEAIAAALTVLGFRASRHGEAGKKDGLLVATIGEGSYRFTFEGKGKASQAGLKNDEAEIAGAANHRDEANAVHAVVVARRFAGFDQQKAEGAAILNECKAVRDVSIIQVDALIELMEAVDEFGYSLDVLRDIFTKIESPEEKLASIRALKAPTQAIDYQQFLDDIWAEQEGKAYGDVVPLRTIWQGRPEWRSSISIEKFIGIAQALEVLAGGRIRITEREIVLLTSPEIIGAQIAKAVTGAA